MTGAEGATVSSVIVILSEADSFDPASTTVTVYTFGPSANVAAYDHVVSPGTYVTPVWEPFTKIVSVSDAHVPLIVCAGSFVVKSLPLLGAVITGAAGAMVSWTEGS